MKIYYFCPDGINLTHMNHILTYILTFFISAVSIFAQNTQGNTFTKVTTLACDETLSQSLTGICAITADGKRVIDINSDKMLVPASNMKLISTGAALHQLGTDFQYETKIAHDGKIIDGTLFGNLYIIGGGDPTTGSKDSIATAIETTFGQWEAIIRSASIHRIEGHIIGDGRSFEGMAEEPTWLWNDTGTYYGTGVTGLMFYENTQSFSVSAGPEVGAPVNISPYYPEAPWMTFRHECTTGKTGSGDQLYMYTSEFAPVAAIRGTFGVDRAAKRLDCANKFPEFTCAYYFCRYLNKNGIECTEGASDFRLSTDWMENRTETSICQDSLNYLGSTFSPTLDRIVFETNHASNNLFAETLFRTLGKEMHSSACYDSSYVAIGNVLKSLNINTGKGAKIQDGSGLSRQNYISPDFLCRFLKAMMRSDSFDCFLESLPSPGGNGTMQYNMKGQPAPLRNRIKVKSGSMNGVRCYSGYILPKEFNADTDISFSELPEEVQGKTIIFSIMTNNCTSPTWKVRPLLDKIMIALSEGN